MNSFQKNLKVKNWKDTLEMDENTKDNIKEKYEGLLKTYFDEINSANSNDKMAKIQELNAKLSELGYKDSQYFNKESLKLSRLESAVVQQAILDQANLFDKKIDNFDKRFKNMSRELVP